MRSGKMIKMAVTGCILMIFTGCGAAPQQSPLEESVPSDYVEAPVLPDSGADITSDVTAENPGSITIAEAKTVVLENAGLSEENVRFVRMQLESENGASRYDIEFISENVEYDYTVDAVTGAILSMTCEMGSYDIEAVPPEIVQPADVPSGAEQQYIGSEAAKQAALGHCGLEETDVRFVHAHLEYDHGRWKYDVEFHGDSVEYDYDIDALTGDVLSFDHDAGHHHHGTANPSADGMITEDRAKQIALEYAGIEETEAQYLKVELDYDDGRAEYEVEWYVGRIEYSCSVDASTGEVLSFEKEWD